MLTGTDKFVTFIDLFGGIGGFRLGLERASKKYKCVWYCDIDKNSVKIYNKNFRESHEPKDAIRINTNEIPDFDLLCAGFPCQAFSCAGKGKGFEDTRGTLFFEIARILRDKQPKLCLLENVKGLLSHNKGETFASILQTLDELGYDAEWQVLNSKYFGVPQNRERVFIIGHLRGTGRFQIFPIREYNTFVSGQNSQRKQKYFIVADRTRTYADSGRNLESPKEICNSLTSVQKDNLVVNSTKACVNDIQIRRLTPIECERLQGFPDNWTSGVSDTQRYKTLGNAVTVSVIEYLVSIISY